MFMLLKLMLGKACGPATLWGGSAKGRFIPSCILSAHFCTYLCNHQIVVIEEMFAIPPRPSLPRAETMTALFATIFLAQGLARCHTCAWLFSGCMKEQTNEI